MWYKSILLAILVVPLWKLFSSHNSLHHYVACGIIIALSLMFFMPCQPVEAERVRHQARQPHSPSPSYHPPKSPFHNKPSSSASGVIPSSTPSGSQSLTRPPSRGGVSHRQRETKGLAKPSPEIQVAPGPSRSNNFFGNSHDFVINHATMIHNQGEDKTSKIMKLLLKYVIHGAAHDDSARNDPPRCHPGTRVKILGRLTTWFRCKMNHTRSLFWLNGPAGVGKSAIIQTFAESVSVEHPVASVFVSRLNKLNDPNRIFPTIAYQLAVRIEAYRNYIVGQLSANPDLLNKNIQVQFRVFITEPFVKRKIGAGGPRLAILLDGLDEVEGVDAQRDIIQRISSFTQEHPDTPLAWIISGRPEAHIINTFSNAGVRYEAESISINSAESCRDVKRYLRHCFGAIRREFPSTTHKNWPQEPALAELAAASSGLFIFAETAVRFIRDPGHANPVSRFKIVLSAIRCSKDVLTGEQPFKHLDNLYALILSDIPSGLLPTTKLVIRLALSLHSGNFFALSPLSRSRTLRGMALILQLELSTVYASLNKCFSILGVPSRERAHQQTLTILHSSFADYLTNSTRSRHFHIEIDGVEDDVLLFYLNLWRNSVSNADLFDEHDDDAQQIAPEDIKEFRVGIMEDMVGTLLTQMLERHKPRAAVSPASEQKRYECLHSLQRVTMMTLCNSKYLHENLLLDRLDARRILFSFVRMAFDAWKQFPHELGESGLLSQTSYKNMTFGPCDGTKSEVVQGEWEQSGRQENIASFWNRSPNLPVLICGTRLRDQVALLKGNEDGTKYCIVPYRA